MTNYQLLPPHLHVFTSAYYLTNSGVFLSGEDAVLIDPCMRPDEIDAIGRFVQAQGATARYLVLTHSHWDHILGPERLPGIPIVAQARYPEVVAREAANIHRDIAQWEASFQRERGASEAFTIPLPDQTFERELLMRAGGLALRLFHIPGHAAELLAVYEPESACLWASDILSDTEIPDVADSLADYEDTLERVRDYDVHTLVPGHGTATTDPAEIRRRLDEDRAYLAELRRRVTQAVRTGQTVEQAVAACADMSYRRPADNAGPHRLNVESAYLELGGMADPRRVGYKQDWTLKRDETP